MQENWSTKIYTICVIWLYTHIIFYRWSYFISRKTCTYVSFYEWGELGAVFKFSNAVFLSRQGISQCPRKCSSVNVLIAWKKGVVASRIESAAGVVRSRGRRLDGELTKVVTSQSALQVHFLLFMQTSNARGQSIREMNLFCCVCESEPGSVTSLFASFTFTWKAAACYPEREIY